MTLEDALIEWRRTRQPALADLVEQLTAERELPRFGTSIAAAWTLARHVFTDPADGDDPRVARALFRVMFERVLFQGGRARTSGEVESFAARLAGLRDVRFLEPLRERLASATAFPSRAADARARPVYEATLAALEQARADLGLASAAPPAVALPAPSTRFVSASVAQALDAVFADPDDDELRRVIGDRLVELGDLRGEYIALAYAERAGTLDDAGRKRMDALYHRNAGNWSGACGPVGKRDGMRFDRGFLCEVSLDKSSLGVNREMWDAALESPYWATVVQINISQKTPDWWLREFLASPRSARVRRLGIRSANQSEPGVLLARAAPGERFRLVLAKWHHAKVDKVVAILGALPDGAEQLRVLEADARAASAPRAVVAAILKAAAEPRAKAPR